MSNKIVYMECPELPGVVLAINPEIAKVVRITAREESSEISTYSFEDPFKTKEENAKVYVNFYRGHGFVNCSQTWFHTIRLKALYFLMSQVSDFSLFS